MIGSHLLWFKLTDEISRDNPTLRELICHNTVTLHVLYVPKFVHDIIRCAIFSMITHKDIYGHQLKVKHGITSVRSELQRVFEYTYNISIMFAHDLNTQTQPSASKTVIVCIQ